MYRKKRHLSETPSRQKTIKVTENLFTLCPWIPIVGYENYVSPYLVRGDKIALVDIGPRVSVPNLIEGLAEIGVRPEAVDYIILTHIHMDHAGGIGTAIKEMKNAVVVAHPRAKAHLIDPTELWQASLKSVGDLAVGYGMIEPVPAEKVVVADEGMEISLWQGMVMKMVLTPGHAAHELSIFETRDKILFSGDAAGSYRGDRLRLSTLAPTRPAELLASMDKLIALGAEKIAYGHFGCYSGAPALLQAVREKFLIWWDAARAVVASGGTADEAVKRVLALDKTLVHLERQSPEVYKHDYLRLVDSLKWLMKTSR